MRYRRANVVFDGIYLVNVVARTPAAGSGIDSLNGATADIRAATCGVTCQAR